MSELDVPLDFVLGDPSAISALYDPVPGNIGLIGDSAILLHFDNPEGVYPTDSASNLANLTPVPPYPTTSATIAAAVGFGTWSNGWLFDAASGNLSPAFGSLTLIATAGTPTYRNAGPLANDYAIGLVTTSDEFDGGASDFDVGATDDVVFLWVGKWSSIPSSDLAILGKVSSAFANGYVLSGFGGSGFGFGAGSGGAYTSRAANYLVGRWHVGIAAIDRTNNALRIGVCALDDGTISLGSVQTPGATSFSTANVFSVGHGGWVGSETTFELASLFGGKGTGVATGIPANMATALANFRTALMASPTSAATFCGRGRTFGSRLAFAAADLVSGSTLELRDVTVQAILSWDLDAQNALGTPGTIIARGKGSSSSEYVSYAVQLQVVDVDQRVGAIAFWWQDSGGGVHVEDVGQFILPTDTDFILLTATRRWESTTSVVCRYYAADQLLAEVTSSDGDIAGSTIGTTTIGTAYSSGTPGAFFCGVLDELRVTDYEMSADEVRETWRRLSIHQPNGVAMFSGLSPPGSRWYANPGNSIAAFVKIVGELLGLAVAKIEELRANWLPDQAYEVFIARWEAILKLAPKPLDSLDVRRARVIGFLSRLRGFSIPALQQAFASVFALDPSDVQILQYTNRITDPLSATLAAERWNIGPTGTWSIASGALQLAASSSTDFSQYPASPCYVRTAIPATSLRRSAFGAGAIIAQVELASITSLPTNELAGLMLFDRASNDALWFGVETITSHKELGYRICQNNAVGAFVSLLNPAPAAPIWLRVRPQTLQDSSFTPILGYSTTDATSGFMETSGVIFTLNPPNNAGVGVIGPNTMSSLQVAFANFELLAYNGDRPFRWFAYRNPGLSGAPDMAGAALVAASTKPAHTWAGVCQGTSVLCDDVVNGLSDRGPLGGL